MLKFIKFITYGMLNKGIEDIEDNGLLLVFIYFLSWGLFGLTALLTYNTCFLTYHVKPAIVSHLDNQGQVLSIVLEVEHKERAFVGRYNIPVQEFEQYNLKVGSPVRVQYAKYRFTDSIYISEMYTARKPPDQK